MTTMLEPFIYESRIAYFSMEFALANEIPTYSGGLGVRQQFIEQLHG